MNILHQTVLALRAYHYDQFSETADANRLRNARNRGCLEAGLPTLDHEAWRAKLGEILEEGKR
jgi:hypothetical protein